MARIRSVKPSFWGNKKVAPVSFEARLLALGLISMQDDEGRFLASVSSIKGYVFPNDDNLADVKVRRWLSELAKTRFVQLYEVDGIKYGQLDKKEQRISHPQPSPLPGPPPEGLWS